MFANLSERKMLGLRGALLAGWLCLIASLIWDPFSAVLTQPGNHASPFSIGNVPVPFQNDSLGSAPYPMGARIFWTMLVPLLPLFLMVFGHEAWRRICPLSFASQIPGYLGLTRKRSRLDRRTGMIDRVAALVDRESWLTRNAWYVQFGLLFAGLTARLLLINSDRHAMAAALLFVICAAVLTGALWGGKTWCNYFCPANIVQKIYTEPRGLLESAPHLSRPALPQSMCRTPSARGDRSACVGCTVNCGDIDLERSYWQGILNPRRRNTYYMFIGLIIGFYGYYYLYAGNWSYYFSGIWTHEASLRDRLFAPGYYLMGQSLPVPRLVAVPLTLASACAATLVCGRGCEALYRRLRRNQRGYTEAIIRNHCLAVSAWISINAFYVFGGRPNLSLLPTAGIRAVDLLIIALTTLWLRQALLRTPARYERESMSSRLLGQLRKLPIDFSRVLDGRNMDDLKPDEVYVLSKVLPAVSHEERLGAYRNVLSQAVSEGDTASAATLKMLEELRTQMELTEDDHTRIIEELGVSPAFASYHLAVTDEERRQSYETYRDMLGNLVASRIRSGRSMDENLADPEFQATTRILRESLQIDEGGHLTALASLSAEDGILSTLLHNAIGELIGWQSLRFAVASADLHDPLVTTLGDLLCEILRNRETACWAGALQLLQGFGAGPVGCRHAHALRAVAGDTLLQFLEKAEENADAAWRDRLEPAITEILTGQPPARDDAASPSNRRVLMASLDEKGNLDRLIADDDPLVAALGLAVFGFASPLLAQDTAGRMLDDPRNATHPLLHSVIIRLADAATEDPVASAALRIRMTTNGHSEEISTGGSIRLTIGSSFDNDIVIPDPAVMAYHAAIRLDDGEFRLQRLDEGPLFVDDRAVRNETGPLDSGITVSFGDRINGNAGMAGKAVSIGFDWDALALTGDRIDIDPVMRLAMLARNPELRRLPPQRLAELAHLAIVRRYAPHAKVLAPSGQPTAFLVHFGSVRLFDPATMQFASDRSFSAGDIIAPAVSLPDAPLLPEIASDFAVLVQLPSAPEIAAAARDFFPRAAPPPSDRAEEAQIVDLTAGIS